MNLLDFITNDDLNIESLRTMPVSFQMINLHTKNFEKAKKQCDEFFCTKQELKINKVWYYTDSSDYQWYGGWRYELTKSSTGYYWLILTNTEKIEV